MRPRPAWSCSSRCCSCSGCSSRCSRCGSTWSRTKNCVSVDDLDGAIPIAAPNPAELEEAARQRGSERSGDMQLTLAPVETAADDGAPLCLELGEINAQGCATSIGLGPEGVVAVLSNDDSLALEGCRERDAEAAGQMVVAGAGGAD